MLNMRAGLQIGIESFSWTLAQFTAAAERAKTLGIDTLLVKIADGTEVWYANLGGGDAWQGVWNVLGAIRAEGVQVLPYFFSYGNQFGAFQGEVNLANYVLSKGYEVCLDMERAWNGQEVLAGQLVSGLDAPVWVSTWADPAIQNWTKVLQALAPKTRAFLPQVYTPFLAGVWQQQYSAAGIPTSQVVPTINDQTLSVAGGRAAITLWEFQQLSDAQLTSAVQSLSLPSGGRKLIIRNPVLNTRYDVVYVQGGTVKRRFGTNPTDLAAATPDDWGSPSGATLVPGSVSLEWTPDGNILGALVSDVGGKLFYKSVRNDGSVSSEWMEIAQEDVLPAPAQSSGEPLAKQIVEALTGASRALEAGLA